MARKTRTAQVLNIVKALAWVIIAVPLVKTAFPRRAGGTGGRHGRVEPSGRMSIPVGRADITGCCEGVTGTIRRMSQ